MHSRSLGCLCLPYCVSCPADFRSVGISSKCEGLRHWHFFYLSRESFIYFVLLTRWPVAEAYHNVTCVGLPSDQLLTGTPCIWAVSVCAEHNISCISHLPPSKKHAFIHHSTSAVRALIASKYKGAMGGSTPCLVRSAINIEIWALSWDDLLWRPKLDDAPCSLDYYTEKC